MAAIFPVAFCPSGVMSYTGILSGAFCTAVFCAVTFCPDTNWNRAATR